MDLNRYPEVDVFIKGLKTLEIELSNQQIMQFMEYYDLLITWNEKMNLTAITEFKEVINKHFLDSLTIVKALRPDREKLLDVGTGAGFPGIPLKIAFPELDITLLDSLNKRLIFLEEVIQKLQLKKVKTIHGRAEDYGKDAQYREKFDLCVSRAVAKLSSLSEYCLPYVKKGGLFISYKSGNIEDEITMSSRAFHILGAQLETVEAFHLPDTDIERTLVVIKKIANTPKNYPRSAGKPSKEPL